MVALYFNFFYLGYFLGEKFVAVFSAKTALLIGCALNAVYVAGYLIPSNCLEKETGGCNHGFVSFLLFVFAHVGGFGASIAWSAKNAYLKLCNNAETEKKHNLIFSIVFGFAGVLAGLLGLALLGKDSLRRGLYIIMVILAVNAALVVLRKFPDEL